MIKQGIISAAVLLSSASLAMPANAQVLTGGLINVTVTDVSLLNNSLNKNQIAALNNVAVPIVVQVPVALAANVCNTTVAVLSAAGSGGACTAKSSSRTFGRAVVRQALKQKAPKK